MNIIVCIKQVPDTNEVKIDPVKGTLIRDGVPSIINPDDKNALEEALKIKEVCEDTKITVISMGPPQAKEALVEALAMGADEAILLSDRAFAGADTWATSTTLAAAIRKIGVFDIIFCGRQAIDGDTAQVGPQIAEHLGIPQITYVESLEIKDNQVIVHRALEDGYFVVKSKMPVLLTAIKELNEPRYPSIKGIFSAYNEKEIKVWTVNDIDVDTSNIGLDGSPTQVKKSFTPESKRAACVKFDGNVNEAVAKLVFKLKERNII